MHPYKYMGSSHALFCIAPDKKMVWLYSGLHCEQCGPL